MQGLHSLRGLFRAAALQSVQSRPEHVRLYAAQPRAEYARRAALCDEGRNERPLDQRGRPVDHVPVARTDDARVPVLVQTRLPPHWNGPPRFLNLLGELLMGALKTFQRLSRRVLSTITGYDAVQDKGRRKAPTPINRSEDSELTPFDRWRLYGAGRDIYRNYSVAAWMVRKHLDYVSTFGFHAKCRNPQYSQLLKDKLD